MEQIEQAVLYALGPHVEPNLKAQANAYCEQVKNSPDGWQICLQLFMKEPKAPHDSYSHFQTAKKVIRNKAAQSVTLLFAYVYPSSWPTFFKDMMALVQTPAGTPSSEKSADFFLRLCITIDEEIARLDIPRNRDEVVRNTNIKDTMRMGDIQILASFWFELLQEFRSANPNIAQLALRNIGAYIAWMDISLVVNDQVMSALYELLGDANLRIAACECLADIISKGMLPLDKLNMIRMLNLTETLGRLDLAKFVEHVARLTNVLGIELCKIYMDNSLSSDAKAGAYALIEQTLPYMLKFLANEYDDTSTAVFAFVNDMLTIFKKQKKAMQPFTQAQQEFLGSLLSVTIMKMKYDDETDWGNEDEEPEEEALFVEMRKNLRIFTDHIAAINEELYVRYVHSVVLETLTKHKSGVKLDWREVELCLYVLYTFGEALPKAAMQFVSTEDSSVLSPLGEMVSEMVSSNISAYPHPSAALQFFENIARYYQYFEHRPDQLPQVLAAFVDTYGVHHSLKQIRSRCWYLFHRFVKSLKSKMGPYVESVLSSIGDLLSIQAEPPVETNTMDGMPIPAASTFDSQLYLFETVGMLISLDAIDVGKQTEYLKIVLEPLVEGIQKSMSQAYNPEDELFLLQLHHYIMAMGSVAKGFPTVPKESAATQPWVIVFKQATEIILNVLQTFNRFEVIRDAARFSFARFITCLGSEVLPYLPTLINSLLTECQVTELVDFLPFIGLAAHKFKPMIYNVMDELLLPLVKRVFDFLNATPSGTDEALLLVELRKSYLNFLMSLFNANLEGVLVSERNIGHLNTILQTVLHFSKDNNDPTIQKMAFGVFLKMVYAWCTTEQQPGVSGFDQFVYNELIPTTFAVPMNAAFNVADGQSLLVFGEMTSIQKVVCSKQGNQFIEYMNNVFFPSIQCPRETAERYCQAVQQYDVKEFKKYFQEPVVYRSSRGGSISGMCRNSKLSAANAFIAGLSLDSAFCLASADIEMGIFCAAADPKAAGVEEVVCVADPKGEGCAPKADGVLLGWPNTDGLTVLFAPKADGCPNADPVAPKLEVAPKLGALPNPDGFPNAFAEPREEVAPKVAPEAPKLDGCPKVLPADRADGFPNAGADAPKLDVCPKVLEPPRLDVAPKAGADAPILEGFPKADVVEPNADVCPNALGFPNADV
ncbi:pre-tRNA nuclear export protein [Apophysomyces ossiformis]|uniref:Exportin-T n=1 Tax=Apophysomyces ossiformis TaxID=679940 RepID=A0A8H7BXP7_9FUNG|nr:pre-tRNA nuclear export protein [Apophysomyces ossiformis]